ncbi:MAG: dependent oxidoreductase, partial [Chloroflexi bacterium]|nr:dependent oxidoreductase [Chloroflexota bacterium]
MTRQAPPIDRSTLNAGSCRGNLAGLSRRSLWLQEALTSEPPVPAPRLDGPIKADVCVVGGGYSGLWTALRISELAPGASIVILEADICGAAASGRNGGFVDTWWAKIASLVKRVGEHKAVLLAKASEEAVSSIGTFCDEHSVDAHFRQNGWLWTATATAHLDSWRTAQDTCERLGVHPFQELDAQEVIRRTGSAAHLGGIFEPAAAT